MSLTLFQRFEALGNAVEADVLQTLIAANPLIQRLHIQYGHPLTVLKELEKLERPLAAQYTRFPLLAFFEDVPERGLVDGLSVVTPRIIVGMSTKAELTRAQRDAGNFRQILWPIVEALQRQAKRCPVLGHNWRKPGTITERPFWGKEGLYGTTANVFNDEMDCIEITGLEFTIRRTRTCGPASFTKNF